MIFEAIPNFSEGSREEICREIQESAERVPGITVADLHMDPDHHRSVLTFLGEKSAIAEAAFRVAEKAVKKIDLNRHGGEHPRMGAIDVLPIVPLREATMEDACELAREVGERIGTGLDLPVFLYEAAARIPERKNLADVRRPRFEGYRDLTRIQPDFGPDRVHPTAGCVAVGARPVLIAYNIDLETADSSIARAIARSIRESNGGLAGIKAIGLHIERRNCAQVSMNVCDHLSTDLVDVFRAVQLQTEKHGIKIRSSEIIGLCPREALQEGTAEEIRLEGFLESQILESHL